MSAASYKDEAALGAYQDLVMENQNKAQKLCYALARRWGIKLPLEELKSAANLALCEAASRYRPMKNASFVTYLFPFIKGALAQSAWAQKSLNHAQHEDLESLAKASDCAVETDHESKEFSSLASKPEISSPEHQAWIFELNKYCRQVLKHLNQLERRVMLESHVAEQKMAVLARHLGYSRGYFFSVRQVALRKARHLLEECELELPA
jgi:RNA polymerase sigma factor (sigma-70 family)